MRKSVFIATSLDGFISRENGDIDWLEEFNKTVPEGEDCGYKNFIKTVDVIVMGRKSFEKVLSFDQWPYTQKVLVLTTRQISIPNHLKSRITPTSDSPSNLCKQLMAEGNQHVYIDGGITIQSFLREGLIDDLTMTTIPILLGKGLSLFGELSTDVKLVHKKTISFPFGAVQSTYQI